MIKTIPLGEVVHVSAGQPAPKPSEMSDYGHPFIRAGSLESLLQNSTEDDCEKISDSVAKNRRLKLYPKDTVVFAKSGMSSKIGRVYKLRQPSYVVSHLATLVPIGKYDPSFLTHWLRQHSPSRLINDHSYPSIRISAIAGLEVPDLEIEEQRPISKILNKADEIIHKRKQTSSLADDLLKSSFITLFGDPASNPKGFSVEKIENHLREGDRTGTQSGPFGSALKKHEYTDSGIPVWGVENVQPNQFIGDTSLFISEEKYEQLSRYRVNYGDVLISRAGTVGRMCIARPNVERSIISTNLVRVSLDTRSLLAEYFVALFTYLPHRLGTLKANNKDSAFTFMNPKTLRSLEIPIPPKSLQKDYRDLVDAVGTLKRRAEKHHRGLEELLGSLYQRAFYGQL